MSNWWSKLSSTKHDPLNTVIEEKPDSLHLSNNAPGNKRHSKMAAYIDPKDYGKVDLRLEPDSEDDLLGPNGEQLTFKHLQSHVKGFGGSGSGKTYRVLNQFVREIFRASHLPPGPEREARKPGLLIIEAKGDYAEKVWRLAAKYGRTEDVILVGPGHGAVYDTFADETETPGMIANKLGTLLDAANDGQKGNDPFWRNSAVEVLSKILTLHRNLRWLGQEVPPMSFHFLGRCLADKGKPLTGGGENNPQTESGLQKLLDNAASDYEQGCGVLCDQLTKTQKGFRSLLRRVRLLEKEGTEEEREWARKVGDILYSPDETSELPDELFYRQAGIIDLVNRICEVSNAYVIHDAKWTANVVAKEIAQRSSRAEMLLQGLLGLLEETPQNGPNNAQTREVETWIATIDVALDCLAQQSQRHQKWVNIARELHQQKLSGAGGKNPENGASQFGALKEMVEQYRAIQSRRTGEKDEDGLLEYFDGNWFNEANDKTNASVALTALTMVAPLAEEPFSGMFGPNPTFRIQQIITEGKLVVLHMPFAVYRDAARMAAILLKCDFFRAVQSQEYYGFGRSRPTFYVVDELGTVLTTGLWTGEKSFMDKARGYGCACIAVSQSIPILQATSNKTEVDGLLTNAQTLIYLRNDDPETQKKGADSSGIYERATGTLIASSRQYIESPEQRMHNVQFRDETWLRPSDFKAFKDGEGLVILPPEFQGKGKVVQRRVRFAGDPLGEICPKCGAMSLEKKFRSNGSAIWTCASCGHTTDQFTPEIPFPDVAGMAVVEMIRKRWQEEHTVSDEGDGLSTLENLQPFDRG